MFIENVGSPGSRCDAIGEAKKGRFDFPLPILQIKFFLKF